MGPRHFCRDRDQDRGTNPQDRGKTEAIDPQDRGQDRGSFGKTEARPRQLDGFLIKTLYNFCHKSHGFHYNCHQISKFCVFSFYANETLNEKTREFTKAENIFFF